MANAMKYVLLLCVVVTACATKRPSPEPASAPSATAVASGDACETKLARCMAMWSGETESCAPLRLAAEASAKPKPIDHWLATGDPSAFASASAAPTLSPPSASTWTSVEDLSFVLGTWVDETKGDAIPNGPTGGKVVDGGVRVVFKKTKGKKTPFSLTFWAPTAGHTPSDSISAGCGFYSELHQKNDGELPWRSAFCKGYGKATDGIGVHLRMERDGKRLRMQLENWLSATLVRR